MLKKLPKSTVGFELIIPWAEWEKYLDVAAKEASAEIKIEGFRPGKAPRKLVEQKIGQGVILNNAAEKAVQKSYADFVVKEKLEAIGRPEVKIEEIKEDTDLKAEVVVAVIPQIEIKDAYKKAIKKINAEFKGKPLVVEEKEVELELEKLANSRVKLVTVRRPAAKNDSVEIDFTVLVDNVPIENGSSQNHPMIIGRQVFIPGFEDNLVGMQEGGEKEFKLNFPKDYHKKDLAGKEAVFKVKMKLVQERQTPEINDDFAKSLGKFESLVALKKNLRQGLEEDHKQKMKEQQRQQYVDKIVENSAVELPDVLVHQEIHQMLHEFEYQLQPMGLNLDQYLKQLKKDRHELEKDWEPQAEKRIKAAMGLKEIATQEEIQVSSEDIEAEMNKTMQYYKNVKDLEKNIDMERLYNFTKGNLENEKVFAFLQKL